MADEGGDKQTVDRRTVLKSTAAVSAAGFVGVPAFSGSAVAQATEETLYLSDSGGNNSPFDGETRLFEVDLVEDPRRAVLSELAGSPLQASDVVYRVNGGGGTVSAIDGGSDWTPPGSTTGVSVTGSDSTFDTGDSITKDNTVPSGTPMEVFQIERYGNQEWDFDVTSGQTYEVRLYFAEIYWGDGRVREGSSPEGDRVFDVAIEGQRVLNDYDIHAEVGHDVGTMKSFTVTPSDGTLEIDFTTKADNAKISAIEIIRKDFTQVDAIAATPDGETIDVIDKNSAHLGRYTVSDGSFTDKGKIDGISPSDEVVLATYSPDGTLYIAGQGRNKLFTVNPTVPETTSSETITDVNVQGADLAFDDSGTLFLYSSNDGKLYTVDPSTGDASEVGGASSQNDKGLFTGLAIRDTGAGDLVGSDTTEDKIVVLDKSDGSEGDKFPMKDEDGNNYRYGFGDMTYQFCTPCEFGNELLVKYEWDDEAGKFVIEDKDDDGSTDDDADENIELTDVTLDKEDEPKEACFTTDYCNVDVVVKAGPETKTNKGDYGEVCVTGIEAENPAGKTVTYAISNVRFFCEAPEDTSVGNSGDEDEDEDEGDGKGNGRGNSGKGDGNKGNGKGKGRGKN